MLAELKIVVGVFAFVMTNYHLKSRYERQQVVRTRVTERFYEIWEKPNPFYPYAVESIENLEPEILKKFKLVFEINKKSVQACVCERTFHEISKGEIVEVHYRKRLPKTIVIEKVSRIGK